MRKASNSNKPQIEQIPLKELEGRYGLGYTSINNRLNQLRMRPIKQGRRSYVSAKQLDVLDQLDRHIKQGGGIQDFLSQQTALGQSIDSEPGHKISTDVAHQGTIIELVRSITALNLPITIQIGTAVDRFAYFRFLEEAAEKGWELTTSDVAELLKIPVTDIEGEEQSFRQAGFVFYRRQNKRCCESQWKVVKEKN